MKKAIQYFSDEYLEQCRSISPAEIVEFLENFRLLQAQAHGNKIKSRLISIKVPENLLHVFKFRAQTEGIPYQTQIKKLMQEWAFSLTKGHKIE
jgi:predicted DNA binding CopG/RHH family protein